jgi:hypothetical protein
MKKLIENLQLRLAMHRAALQSDCNANDSARLQDAYKSVIAEVEEDAAKLAGIAPLMQIIEDVLRTMQTNNSVRVIIIDDSKSEVYRHEFEREGPQVIKYPLP